MIPFANPECGVSSELPAYRFPLKSKVRKIDPKDCPESDVCDESNASAKKGKLYALLLLYLSNPKLIPFIK